MPSGATTSVRSVWSGGSVVATSAVSARKRWRAVTTSDALRCGSDSTAVRPGSVSTARRAPNEVGSDVDASPDTAVALSVGGMASADSTIDVTPADASTLALLRSMRPNGAQ